MIRNNLKLYVESQESLKEVTVDIAKAMKANIVQLTIGDYLIIMVSHGSNT